MAFDLFFLRQVGKNRLGVEWHDDLPRKKLLPRRTQCGRAATKENGNFHHEAHEGHEGKEIRRNFVPNFVLFVSFVVICKFSQSAQIFNYSNTKDTKEELSRKGSKSVFVMSNGPIGARNAFYGNLRAFVVHILYMNHDNY